MSEKDANSNPVIIPQSYPLKAIKEDKGGYSGMISVDGQEYLIIAWIKEGDKLSPLGVPTSRDKYSSNRPVKLAGKVRYIIPTQWIEDVNS